MNLLLVFALWFLVGYALQLFTIGFILLLESGYKYNITFSTRKSLRQAFIPFWYVYTALRYVVRMYRELPEK